MGTCRNRDDEIATLCMSGLIFAGERDADSRQCPARGGRKGYPPGDDYDSKEEDRSDLQRGVMSSAGALTRVVHNALPSLAHW
jgi:hypothetical protein